MLVVACNMYLVTSRCCSRIDNGVGLAALSCQAANKLFNLCALEYPFSPLDPP